MSRAIPWISKFCLVALVCGLAGCALFEERKGPPTFYGSREETFFATFEEAWRASNLALQAYPLRVSNMDQGILETDTIHGFKVWVPPYKPDAASAGQTYHLTLRVIKVAHEDRQAIRVLLLKDTEVQVDFFSDPRSVASDGLEEKAILYRIGREIQIERALAKAQKRHNQEK